MLARAARRKLRRDAFRSPSQLSDQLTLPWLCPAQMRWNASASSISTPSRDSRKQRIPSSLAPRYDTRSLATAAELQPAPSQSPFNGFIQPWGAHVKSSELPKFTQWDPTKTLVIGDTSLSAPVTVNSYGIGGDPTELYQNLYACLRVGRMDRASAIVQRLVSLFEPTAPEVVEANSIYLQTMFELAQEDHNSTSLEEIEDFYNTRIVQQGIEPNAQIFVTLLRATMNFLEGNAKEDAIRRYLAMAHEYSPEIVHDINASPEFSDEEWELLIRLQPDTFEEPPSVTELQELQHSTPTGRQSLFQHGLLPETAVKIKPVPQKGLGLTNLQDTLRTFEHDEEVPYPHEMEGTTEEKDRAYAFARQLRLEEDSASAAAKRWKAEDAKLQEIGVHGVLKTKPIQALMGNWYSALLPRVKEELKKIKQVLVNPTAENRRDDRHVYGAYLESCKPEKIAALTISRVIVSCVQTNSDDTSGLKVAQLSTRLGSDVEEAIFQDEKQRRITWLKKQRGQTRKNLMNKLAKHNNKIDSNSDQTPTPGNEINKQLDQMTRTEFPLHVRIKIGALLLGLMLQTATVTVTAQDPKTGKQLTSTQSAFQHSIGFANGKRVGWVKVHAEIQNKLRAEPVSHVNAIKPPMVYEPKPWIGYQDGGYYTTRSPVVRTKNMDHAQRAYAVTAIENGDMDKVLAGLDVLGKVPWQINKEVFEVMAEVWNSGEGLAGLVPEKSGLERPEEPPSDASYRDRAVWAKKVKQYENTISGLHSQRCFQNFQLESARAYVKEKQIFFPHSVDFRGRAYPIPALLNHIGNDVSRGLLKFANGKELGTVGLQWLKVHLANLYGYDKASLSEREQFAMDNINEIYDSATNPLSGNRWWLNAEDPWQCLACCVELKKAFDSPDPTRFVSQLPVHQDGTCNGLQHYAALGGDHAGATQVNLEPSDRPQDIYTGVADVVTELVADDAAKGDRIAHFMKGKINRKLVKRTVMTNVYGVTFIGARLQVLDELQHMFPNFEEQQGIKHLGLVASYIARKIFIALSKIFNGAQEIQYWLGECGDRIVTSISPEQIKKIQEYVDGKATLYDPKFKAKKATPAVLKRLLKNLETFKSSIIWTTPLKMPVVQPYRKDALQLVKTPLQDINVSKRSTTNTVDKRKQLQGFPPNFIHSLDASHMLLSALKCDEMGLNFAAVHDSFWTHAADIPNLSAILRDAFVQMHSEDIIGRLAAEFKARYAGSMYRANIVASSTTAKKIAAWRRENRLINDRATIGPLLTASFDEVALEAKRQDLLKSEDPEERKKGEEMVTPTSIFQAEQDPTCVVPTNSALLGETKAKVAGVVVEAEVEAMKESLAETTAATIETDSIVDADIDAVTENLEAPSEEKNASASKKTIVAQVWLPLSFPPVPKKGSWDVSRLRESQYFFS